MENKRAVVQDFEKRIESLSHELDSLDAQQLEQTLGDLRTQFLDLLSLLASRADDLTALLGSACQLDDELEIVRQWLREKEQDLRRIGAPAEDEAELRNRLESVQVGPASVNNRSLVLESVYLCFTKSCCLPLALMTSREAYLRLFHGCPCKA